MTIRLLAILLLNLVLVRTIDIRADERPSLPQEVYDAWAKQIENYKHLSGTTVSYSLEADKKTLIRKEDFKRSESAASRVNEESNGKKRARVTNSKYTFFGEKRPNSSSWLLIDLMLNPNAHRDGEYFPVIEDTLYKSVRHLVIADRFISEAIDNAVRIEKSETLGRNIKLYIRFDPSKTVRKKEPRTQGWVLLDADFDWSIREAFVEIKYFNNVAHSAHSIFELTRTQGGIPFAKTERITVSDPTTSPPKVLGVTLLENEYTFGTPIADTEFTLAAYGLPEPKGFEVRRKTPTYVWWIVGGAVFLAMGAILRVRRRKP